MYLHSSNDIRPINFWSFFLHVIVLHFMDSKYLRFLYYQFSCVFDPSSSLFNFIFYCDILPVLCKNEALDQKYSNLCACTREEPAHYLWNLNQTLPDCLQHFVRLSVSPVIWHDSFPHGRPSRVCVWFVSSYLLTDRADLLCADRHPFTMPREQMEWEK